MQETANIPKKAEGRASAQMLAVLTVFSSDANLMAQVLPFIDLDQESILWEEIFKLPFGSDYQGAVDFAYGLWTDRVRENTNLFDAALSLNPKIQAALLQALALRWGLK
ncbi:MAG: hypothetical protein ACXVCE_09030 [Bacteriovorax sp.]